MKRAITLAGGGPAAGLHIGALQRFEEEKIKFDVWALSCIGAWVGLVYNQCDPGNEAAQTYDFFRNGVFRDDVSYSRFPINTVFGADSVSNTNAMVSFFLDPRSYQNLWLPEKIMESARETLKFMADRAQWNEGDFNRFTLNHVLAANPFVRYWTSVMYLSNMSGLSRICYPDSTFMKSIKFERLFDNSKPFIFLNAWNITKQRLDLFSNRPGFESRSNTLYRKISPESLCACSALPFVEQTVDIDGDTYCEGALVDTVNFRELIQDHDLDEIWISRIVDSKQVRPPRNLTDALGNLCMLFAATVGEDDIKLFKFHAEREKWGGKIIEIKVADSVTFDWTHSNLDRGVLAGRQATGEAIRRYRAGEDDNDPDPKPKAEPAPLKVKGKRG